MDTSFPAGTITLSNMMPKEHQGTAASLVATVVNYSISVGLGIAGTVERTVNNGEKDTLKGYRAAFYTSIVLSCVGILVSIVSAVHTTIERNRSRERQ
jgi:MFS family permease